LQAGDLEAYDFFFLQATFMFVYCMFLQEKSVLLKYALTVALGQCIVKINDILFISFSNFLNELNSIPFISVGN
jgi:hypothetical protein